MGFGDLWLQGWRQRDSLKGKVGKEAGESWGAFFFPRPPLGESSDLLRTWALGTLHWENLLTVVARAARAFPKLKTPAGSATRTNLLAGKAYLPTLSNAPDPFANLRSPGGVNGPRSWEIY